jgi:hypothetical protein
VFGHKNITEDVELVSLPETLESIEEDDAGVVVVEVRETLVTTERDEMVMAEGMVTLEAARHLGMISDGCPVHGRVVSMSGLPEC